MHVWIQGQLPAGCKLALSHRFSLLSVGGLYQRRTWPSITLCFGADGFCIAEWMGCLSPLGTPSHQCWRAPWDGVGSMVGWPNRLILVERGFWGYPISGLSPQFAEHPSCSRGCQHWTLTPKVPRISSFMGKAEISISEWRFPGVCCWTRVPFPVTSAPPSSVWTLFPSNLSLIEVSLLVGNPEITPKIQRKISWKGFQRPQRNDSASYSKCLPFFLVFSFTYHYSNTEPSRKKGIKHMYITGACCIASA